MADARVPLVRRNLQHHWRMHTAVALGVAVSSAALTGALLVGDSMRGSLRTTALQRLGRVETALLSAQSFDQRLQHRLNEALRPAGVQAAPALIVTGDVTHATARTRAEGVQILGAQPDFFAHAAIDRTEADALAPLTDGLSALVSAALAQELRLSPGDDVLVRTGKPADIAPDSLLGKREETTTSLRLRIAAVLPAGGAGDFSLAQQVGAPRTLFVPLAALQRATDQRGRLNALLLTPQSAALDPVNPGRAASVQASLQAVWTLADVGIRLRVDDAGGYVALEADSLLLEPALEAAADRVSRGQHRTPLKVLAHLANSIVSEASAPAAAESRPAAPPRAIPYSTVVGVSEMHMLGDAARPLAPGEAALNAWTAQRLGAQVGDRVHLTYFASGADGQRVETTTAFRLAAILPMTGAGADRRLAPDYPGVTDALDITDWDPPFPIDLNRIEDDDEAYWDKYGAAPKALVSLADAQRLWTDGGAALGRLTAMRFFPREGETLAQAAAALEAGLRQELSPAQAGLVVSPARAQALRAATGTTDFGGLFIGFSLFLIAAAAMLTALLFRLGVEQRSAEVGLLLALGYKPGAVRSLLLREGLLVAALGAALGCGLALIYAQAMITGLSTAWSAAVSSLTLALHATPQSFATGYLASILIAGLAILTALRGLTAQPPRQLLAGQMHAPISAARLRGWLLWGVVGAALVTTGGLLAWGWRGAALARAGAFFGAGALLLIAALCLARLALATSGRGGVKRPGPAALMRLGARSARRNPGRSMLTVGMIAAATFLITAISAFRLSPPPDPLVRSSGAGGFNLMAEAAAPLLYDLGTADGRTALGMSDEAQAALRDIEVRSARLRSGDEASCLGLYRPDEPRVLGVGDAWLHAGGFAFAAAEAPDGPARENPWLLLGQPLADGVIAAVGDEASVLWQLHKGLGQELVIRDERGAAARLRFVALLRGSPLQGEIIVHERDFRRLFPRESGQRFFLVRAAGSADVVEQALERELERFGFDVRDVAQRIAALAAVQNTYLAAFQLLGAIGLLFGGVGLAVVLLRNTWERRRESGLLSALGYSRRALATMLLTENVGLALLGVACGLGPALVAALPQLLDNSDDGLWLRMVGLLTGVLLVTLVSGLVALALGLRGRLVAQLRGE